MTTMDSASPSHFGYSPHPRVFGRDVVNLDVTLRDGGFAVGFGWPESLATLITHSLAQAGVDIVELGYIGGLPELHGQAAEGTTASLSVDYVRACSVEDVRTAAMVHPSALSQPIEFGRYAEAGLSLVRIVYHQDWVKNLLSLAEDCRVAGLAVTFNIALASRYDRSSLIDQIKSLHDAGGADVIYLADTCGALVPDDVAELIAAVASVAPDTALGFHAHDFMRLALANSLEAAKAGATYIDSSLLGLGRSAGNLPTELWLLATGGLRLAGAMGVDAALAAIEEVRPRQADVVFAAAAAALNLTPPEEDALAVAAGRAGISSRLLALELVTRVPGITITREVLDMLATEVAREAAR